MGVQHAVIRPREHDGHHHVLVVPLHCGTGPIQERRPHLWPGYLHRSVPLHPYLQFLGGGLSLLCGQKRPGADGRALQRRLPVHGLAADGAAVADRDSAGHEVGRGDLPPRWICWAVSMCFFLYIVFELLVGLKAATESEIDPSIKGKIQLAQVMTVFSWCTYPVVYLFPMLGITASSAVVAIQIGYCVSDIISKCGVGLIIYQVTYAKSNKDGALLP